LLTLNKKKETYLYFEKLVPEHATIAVIGASIGITTIPFANGKRTIFAYEPIPSNVSIIARLKQKYRADKLSIFQLALGNRTGKVEFIFPKVNGAKKHGLSYVKDVSIENQPEGEVLTVEIDRFDNRPELEDKKIEAMKVIAENYEFEIFSGATEIINRDSPVIYCELWDNVKRPVVLDLIRSMNYVIWVLIDGKLENYENHCDSYQGKHFIFRPR